MKRLFIILFFAVVLLSTITAAGGYFVYNQFITTPNEKTESFVLDIKPGMSFNRISQKLAEEGIITQPALFKVYARLEGTARQVKAGETEFPASITPVEVASILISNKRVEHSFTIIEGISFKELEARLKLVDTIKHTLNDNNKAEFLESLSINNEYFEGLFLADTYRYRRGESDLDILRRANKLLNDYLTKEWDARQKSLPYKSAYEALIMASIVEKETGRASERPEIAGVFVRRLNKRMRLQTDPTVIYGMGDAYDGNIRKRDLRKPTPYNTYVIPALPPSPIAMVGREAIKASLNPNDGKALYFVAKGDGSHYFSATLAEHNRAVREYQLSRKSNYRSSP